MPRADHSPLRPPQYTARLSTVRRLLAIVLLTILPLQFSWAAVAAYCAHESSAASDHLGHHDHQHSAPALALGDGPGEVYAAAASGDAQWSQVDGQAPAPQADKDCGTCQLAAAQPIPRSMSGTLMPLGQAQHHASSPAYDSHIPAGPRRPDRAVPTPAVRFGGVAVTAPFPKD